MSTLPTVKQLSDSVKSYIHTNLIDAIAHSETLEHVNPSQVATLFCSASVATSLGYHLYKKYKYNTQYEHDSEEFNYNEYRPILTASAPGKVILSGEHAVVYGATAISTAINKRTNVTIYEPVYLHRVIKNLSDKPLNDGQSPIDSKLVLNLDHVQLMWKIADLIAVHNLNVNKWNITLIQKQFHLLKPHVVFKDTATMKIDTNYIETHPLYGQKGWEKSVTSVVLLLLFQCFNGLFNDKLFISHGIVIDVKSDIPIGAGLGSSSAWSTALSAALYYYWVYVTAGQRKTKMCSSEVQTISRIWKLAYEAEKINHGTPSGIDNTTSLYGGYIRFKTKEDFRVVDVNQQFVRKLPLLVINTGVAGNTKKLVHGVRALLSKHGRVIHPIFQSMEEIGNNLMNALSDKEMKASKLYKNVNELFAINHGLLCSIGVGHSVINQVQNICGHYGFTKGFKITGAGGGGCVIVSLLSKQNAEESSKEENETSCVDRKLIERLRKKLASKGYESYLIETGQPGLTCKFH